jgi:uncharacterized short protein YbdD (DUF466 family)
MYFGYSFWMSTYFSDRFGVDPDALERYGALDVSLVADLPLFIDPFLLFNSKKPEYRHLHDELIRYLVFLRNRSQTGEVSEALLRAWYCFPEVKQTWLGFSVEGNKGSGLGIDFARTLHRNLHRLFPKFGVEKITKASHIEKVCLIREGVGRDNISDFVTNLIKDFLCTYTEAFAIQNLKPDQVRVIGINNALFNYETESWVSKQYTLPWTGSDYVILSPKDLLTRDENWINKHDLLRRFDEIPPAISDEQLRSLVSNYFQKMLPRYPDKEPMLRNVPRPFPKDAGERDCYRYLLKQMQATPDRPLETKAEFDEICRRRFRVTGFRNLLKGGPSRLEERQGGTEALLRSLTAVTQCLPFS